MRLTFVFIDKMADEGERVTFAVTVIEKKGPETIFHARNSIRKFSTNESWFDVFSALTENVAIDPEIDEHFEKIASVQVSSNLENPTQFSPDTYDKISVLYDFDKTLKYVTITIKTTPQQEEQCSASAPALQANAFDILMRTDPILKKPSKIPTDKPRFNGMFYT